ncbi:hypothetical protein KM043_016939 [Ampulex compressa]|nr:hypothetical protein KM043_016939 [Ampulex compressa]
MRKRKISNRLPARKDLEQLEKEDLIDKIMQLKAQNDQLKTVISISNDKRARKIDNIQKKQFDFSRCHKRHILLKLYYLGWDYHGFVVQEDTSNTIEHYLFAALKKSCCIESRETANYHRCGRTDKGVSAFSQVLSLDIRSRLEPKDQKNVADELPYYAMDKAVKYTIGDHDFRNMCKMDVANGVVNFMRSVINAKVVAKQSTLSNVSGYDMCELNITSQAFLWHQIRSLMGVLLLVGQGKEQPEVVLELLDVTKCPYEKELMNTIKVLQQDWTLNMVKSVMIRDMLYDLESLTKSNDLTLQSNCLLLGVHSTTYRPLLERETCESLESKIKHYQKKKKFMLSEEKH